jgi:hypothetical protein
MNHRERMRGRRRRPPSGQFAEVSSQTRPSIEFRIDELVISWFGFASRSQIGGNVQSELSNVLTEHGLPPDSLAASTRESIDGGTISLPRNATAEQMGNKIARAVYHGLSANSRIGSNEFTKT